jgi:hypothetical protein
MEDVDKPESESGKIGFQVIVSYGVLDKRSHVPI